MGCCARCTDRQLPHPAGPRTAEREPSARPARHRRSEANQVAYSRLYMAGHYRSDLMAGALLGYLIGDYEIHVTS